jgi:hypothetical protein
MSGTLAAPSDGMAPRVAPVPSEGANVVPGGRQTLRLTTKSRSDTCRDLTMVTWSLQLSGLGVGDVSPAELLGRHVGDQQLIDRVHRITLFLSPEPPPRAAPRLPAARNEPLRAFGGRLPGEDGVGRNICHRRFRRAHALGQSGLFLGRKLCRQLRKKALGIGAGEGHRLGEMGKLENWSGHRGDVLPLVACLSVRPARASRCERPIGPRTPRCEVLTRLIRARGVGRSAAAVSPRPRRLPRLHLSSPPRGACSSTRPVSAGAATRRWSSSRATTASAPPIAHPRAIPSSLSER